MTLCLIASRLSPLIRVERLSVTYRDGCRALVRGIQLTRKEWLG